MPGGNFAVDCIFYRVELICHLFPSENCVYITASIQILYVKVATLLQK